MKTSNFELLKSNSNPTESQPKLNSNDSLHIKLVEHFLDSTFFDLFKFSFFFIFGHVLVIIDFFLLRFESFSFTFLTSQ